jgi:hypothetical protein
MINQGLFSRLLAWLNCLFASRDLSLCNPQAVLMNLPNFFNLMGTYMIRLLAPIAAVFLFTACATPAATA